MPFITASATTTRFSRRFVWQRSPRKVSALPRRSGGGKQRGQPAKRSNSSVITDSSATTGMMAMADTATPRPTQQQLWRVFNNAAVPMIGFGFTDQTVMLQAGNLIDCTIGVTFGISTLTAAAFGQICSDASGVLFGGTLERLAERAGLPKAGLTNAQRGLPVVKRFRLAGGLAGVLLGCCLGLLNLLFIDTNRSASLKLQAFNEEQEFEFTIEASNVQKNDVTALTVRGPDVDGLLASMTAALSVRNCSLVELHAKRQVEGDSSNKAIEDVFYVVNRETGEPFDDDELEPLARSLLDSTRTPMNVNTVKAAMHELESTNSSLRQRIQKLEQVVYERQIKVIPKNPREGETLEEF